MNSEHKPYNKVWGWLVLASVMLSVAVGMAVVWPLLIVWWFCVGVMTVAYIVIFKLGLVLAVALGAATFVVCQLLVLWWVWSHMRKSDMFTVRYMDS